MQVDHLHDLMSGRINEFNLYKEDYLNVYESMAEAKQSLKNQFEFYNQSRKRQTLNAPGPGLL